MKKFIKLINFEKLIYLHTLKSDIFGLSKDFSNMNILITGGAGFIGSHVADLLIINNHNVCIIDNYSSGKEKNIEHLFNKINFINESVSFSNLNKFKKVDCVIHFAAQTSVPYSIENFYESSLENINLTLMVLNFCKENFIPIVYASSSAVYGDLPFGDDLIQDINLTSPYATDKYISELYSKMVNSIWNISSIGLRFFNVYGPRQDGSNPYSGVISIFIENMIKRKPVIVNGGEQTRDFIYVNDIAEAVLRSINIVTSQKVCHVINLLTGQSTSINQLLHKISKLMKIKPEVIFKDLPVGDPLSSNGQVLKMYEILKFKDYKFTDLDEGLQKLLNYYSTIN